MFFIALAYQYKCSNTLRENYMWVVIHLIVSFSLVNKKLLSIRLHEQAKCKLQYFALIREGFKYQNDETVKVLYKQIVNRFLPKKVKQFRFFFESEIVENSCIKIFHKVFMKISFLLYLTLSLFYLEKKTQDKVFLLYDH